MSVGRLTAYAYVLNKLLLRIGILAYFACACVYKKTYCSLAPRASTLAWIVCSCPAPPEKTPMESMQSP